MNRRLKFALSACAVALLAGRASAEVSLNSVRVGAADPVGVAKFYQTAFGMQEVNRIQVGSNPEIFLNFGATVDLAKANQGLRLVIMHRDSDALKDVVPHIIFTVTDMAATAAAVRAAGGTMDGEPRPFGNSGLLIGFAADPAGNRLELIQNGK